MRILLCVIGLLLAFVGGFVGWSLGVAQAATSIITKPTVYRSIARVSVQPSGRTAAALDTLQSEDMLRRTVDRLRALHPELNDSPPEIGAKEVLPSVLEVAAQGHDPDQIPVFLKCLLEEAQRPGDLGRKATYTAAEAREVELQIRKLREDAGEFDRQSLEDEKTRLSARLVLLRDQRDDLELEPNPNEITRQRQKGLSEQLTQVENALKKVSSALREGTAAEQNIVNLKEKLSRLMKQWETETAEAKNELTISVMEQPSMAIEKVELWAEKLNFMGGFGAALGALPGILLVAVAGLWMGRREP